MLKRIYQMSTFRTISDVEKALHNLKQPFSKKPTKPFPVDADDWFVMVLYF